MPVDKLNTGDVIDIFPYEGVTKRHGTEEVVCNWSLKTEVLLDEVSISLSCVQPCHAN